MANSGTVKLTNVDLPLEPLTGFKLILLTMAVSFATFMEVLDTTVVNVSIPHIAGSLGASTTQGTWTISSYTLASAIAVPLTGWLAKRFGEVRMFVLAILSFTFMSALCGMAQNLEMLIVFRFFQGLFSGPMVPLSQTLLLASYPLVKRGFALSIWSMTVIIAPIFGPVIGGYISENYSWPWIFYINVPVGLISAAIAVYVLQGRETFMQKNPIDYIGIMLLFIGVGSLQLMLDNGNDKDWFSSSFITTLTIIAVIALTFFIIWEITEKNPIIDLSLFKSRNFLVGIIILSLGMASFFGSMVIFPLWLQTVKMYTSTWSGLATAPVGLLAFVIAPIVGRNIIKLNLRMLVSFAFIIFGITMYWFSTFPLDSEYNQLIVPRIVQGIGLACFFIPLNQIILSGLSNDRIAAASGLSNFFRALSSSFATAIVTFGWDHRQEYHYARLTEHVSTFDIGTQEYLNELSSLGMNNQQSYAYMSQIISQQSYTMALNDIFWLLSIIFCGLTVLVWLARPPFIYSGKAGAH